MRWLWLLGLAACFVVVGHLVPGGWAVKVIAAICSSCLYIVAGGPIAIVNPIERFRWYWILGAVICATSAVLFTPADPVSALVVAITLGCFYVAVAYVWRRRVSVGKSVVRAGVDS
jgi:hypothetical protein